MSSEYIILFVCCLSFWIGQSRGCDLSRNISKCYYDGEGPTSYSMSVVLLPKVVKINVADTTKVPSRLRFYCFTEYVRRVVIRSPAWNKYIDFIERNKDPEYDESVIHDVETFLNGLDIVLKHSLQDYYLDTGSTNLSVDVVLVCSESTNSYRFDFQISFTKKAPSFSEKFYQLEIITPWMAMLPINYNTDIIVSDINIDAADPAIKIIFSSSDSRVIVENTKLCSDSIIMIPCLYHSRIFLTSESKLYEDIQFNLYATLESNETLRAVADVSLRLIHKEVDKTCKWSKCSSWDEFGQEWEGYPEKTTTKNCPRLESNTSIWECLPNGRFSGETPNYYKCSTLWLDKILDDDAYTEESLLQLRNRTHEAKHSNNLDGKFYGHEIPIMLKIVQSVLKNIQDINLITLRRMVEHALVICWNILTNIYPWKQLEYHERPNITLALLKTMESCLFTFSLRKFNQSDIISNQTVETFAYEEFIAMTGILLLSAGKEQSTSLPTICESGQSCIELEVSVQLDLIFATMKIEPRFLPSILPGSSNILGINGTSSTDKVVNAPLMTFSIYQHLLNDTGTAGITEITFRHDVHSSGSRNQDVKRRMHEGEMIQSVLDSSVCVFWDETNSAYPVSFHRKIHLYKTVALEILFWMYPEQLYEGLNCVTSRAHQVWLHYLLTPKMTPTKVVSLIETSNLFSHILLCGYIRRSQEKQYGLQILTIILSSLSAICLIACIIFFSTDTSLDDARRHRVIIIKHICVSLLLGNIFMLLLVDRNYLHLSEGVCITVSVLTQYIYLTAFIWMGIEGFYLFLNVVMVFNVSSDLRTLMKYRICAFGIPVLIVGLSALIGLVNQDEVFGGINYCWLEGNYIWSFLGPIGVIITGNIISIYLAIRAANKVDAGVVLTIVRPSEFRSRIRGFLGLSLTLGLSWILGFFILIPDSLTSVIFAYIFNILCASQGILIALFYLILNKRLHVYLRKKKFSGIGIRATRNIVPSSIHHGISTEIPRVNTRRLHRNHGTLIGIGRARRRINDSN